MSDWVMLSAEKSRDAVRRLGASLDPGGRLLVARDADDLRSMVASAEAGELGVIVGPVEDGVSDINLAAAVAKDGNARVVVLASECASGSLRSRAARAGVDLVVDLAELGEGPGAGDEPPLCDGGRSAGAAVPPQGPPTDARGGAMPAPEASPVGVVDAPVLVFCSGRGGVGKTSLAAVSACVAARWGMRTCLVDLDLSCGNAYAALGLPGGSDLAALSSPEGVTPELAGRLCRAAAQGVSLAGPCERPETAELAMPHVRALLDLLSREYDLVVVDTSTTFTDAVAQAAQRADRLVLVTDGRTPSVASLARMGGLAVRLGVARTRIVRVENRADPRERTSHALARAEVGLEAARAYRVVEGGREVVELLAAGRACELAEPGLAFTDSLSAALAQMLAELGRLPEGEEPRRASEGTAPRGLRSLFGQRREAR